MTRPGPEARSVEVTEVRFTAAGREDLARGLLGWASFLLDGWLRVDGITVRRTLAGRITLAFPARLDSRGRRHYCLRPVHDRGRRELEHAVLRALGFTEVRA